MALQPTTLADIASQVSFTFLDNPDGTGAFGGSVAPDSSSRVFNLKCKFEDHEKLIKLLAGYPVTYGQGTGATVSRNLPCQYPWNPNLWCQRIGIKAAGLDGGVSLTRPYTSVILTCEFTTLPYDPKDTNTPFTSIQVKGSGSYITWPNAQYSFSSGEKIDADVGVPISELTFEIAKFNIPDFDNFLATVLPLTNKVNSDTVTISKTTFAAGYLLFPTFDLTIQQSALGTPQYSAVIPLQWRSVKWNQGLRSDGTYDTITPAPFGTAALAGLVTL